MSNEPETTDATEPAPPPVDVTTEPEAATVVTRATFVAKEHQAAEPGQPPYVRQPGDQIQADGTREPEAAE